MRKWICAGIVLALQLGSDAWAGDGSMTETIVWKQQKSPIAVSYSRDRDGVGRLLFRDMTSRKLLPVTYRVESDRDFAKNLTVASMQGFNDLFVLTLETSSGYLIQIFTHDEQTAMITEVASSATWWQPELMYFGDEGLPAVGIPKQPIGSRSREKSQICGVKLYVLNPQSRRIEEMTSGWNNRGSKEAVGKYESSCGA